MPEVTVEESLRQTEALGQKARNAERAGDFTGAVELLQQLLAHPCACHQVAAAEVWDDIHRLHRRVGNYDAAIAAKQTAIEGGCRSEPDPETDIAECHLLAGRRSEGDRMFSDLRVRTPDDVWLYNAAGFSYSAAGDQQEAERWCRDGIAVAIRTGDRDQVVVQLLDLLDISLRALGQEPDADLALQVEAFCAAWKPIDRPRSWGDPPVSEEGEQPCGYCGFDPDHSHDEIDERARRNRLRVLSVEDPEASARLESFPDHGVGRRRQQETRLSMAWFPATEWSLAQQRWPGLLEGLPRDHLSYSHEIEARIKRIAQAIPRQLPHVSPVIVEGLVAYAAAQDKDPSSGATRAAYAAEILRSGEAVPWPPGRNEKCWCNSGSKYKRCCGPVPAAPMD